MPDYKPLKRRPRPRAPADLEARIASSGWWALLDLDELTIIAIIEVDPEDEWEWDPAPEHSDDPPRSAVAAKRYYWLDLLPEAPRPGERPELEDDEELHRLHAEGRLIRISGPLLTRRRTIISE